MTGLQGKIAEELQAFLRVRKVSDLGDIEIPILNRLVGRSDSTELSLKVDAIQSMIGDAVDRLGEGPHKEAARALFRDSLQFASMKEKGSAAALEFGISYDAFRRRSGSGSSRLDETVDTVAGSIAVAHQADVPDPEPATRSLLAGRGLVALAVAAVVALGAAALVLTNRDGDESVASASQDVQDVQDRRDNSAASLADLPASSLDPVPCSLAVGETSTGVQLSAQRRDKFTLAFEANGGEAILGCASEPVVERSGILWQELKKNNIAAGGLLGVSDEEVLYLNPGQWRSYIRIGGGDGSKSVQLGGVPTGETGETPRGWTFILDSDVEMLAESEGGNYYWLPTVISAAWNEEGRFAGIHGAPAGNPRLSDEGLRQDFENGYLILRGSGELDWIEVPDPGAALPPAEDLAGRLVTDSGGTAWLIDQELRRWWIVDGTHWFCAGGDRNVAVRDLDGYTIHTLEYGGRFSCPGASSGVLPAGGGTVFREYCEAEVASGSNAEFDEEGGWRCTSGDDWLPISVADACRWQYGPNAVGSKDEADPNTWLCENP